MYPLRLEVTPRLKHYCNLSYFMPKKTSGRKPSVRHPGRRKFKSGPKPGSNNINEKQIEPLCIGKFMQQQNEKIIKNHLKDKEPEKTFRAFHGWKSFHEGFKTMMLTGVCFCEACLLRVALEEAWENRILCTESEILCGDPTQNAERNRIWGLRGSGCLSFTIVLKNSKCNSLCTWILIDVSFVNTKHTLR